MIFRREPAPQQQSTPEELALQLLQADPAYQVGSKLIGELCERGMGEAEAAQLLLGGQQAAPAAIAARAANELIALKERGDLHGEAEQYLADEAFVALLCEMPATAAVRLYELERRLEEAERLGREQGEQAALEKLRARRALPASIKGSGASAARDYAGMSSEEFAAIKQQLSRAAREGRRVTL